MKIDTLFREELSTESDIFGHLNFLSHLASECSSVTEFGVRNGKSTIAFIHGRPKKVISYDIVHTPVEKELQAAAQEAGVDFSFYKADDLKIEIEPTDLLFIDTQHTYNQLIQELNKHSVKVNKYIVLHDTTTFGIKGEVGGDGLWPAVEEFERNFSSLWHIKIKFTHNNGLTVLERLQ